MGLFRHPRTTQERRNWSTVEEIREEHPCIKGCRRSRSTTILPTLYDDLISTPLQRKSWKYYREHQYRPKVESCVKERRPKIKIDAQAIHGRRRYFKQSQETHYFRVREKYRRYKFEKWDGACIQTTFNDEDDFDAYCKWKRNRVEEMSIQCTLTWQDQLLIAQRSAKNPFPWIKDVISLC
jgi:hypothetical protein